MKVVSFNVNGIRARLHQIEKLIEKHSPDIIGLQEIKVQDSEFPLEHIENLGYNVEHFGQKGHYGVAIMSKNKPVLTNKGFHDDNEDSQKRLIHSCFDVNGNNIHILNGYFPQGENRDHPTKFPMKKEFYEKLNQLLENDFSPNDNIIIMGDFNISTTDLDVGIGEKNAKRWLKTGKCSFLPEERQWMQRLLDFGLYDTFRKHYPEVSDKYSWFDYRSKGFNDDPKRGLRIDLILATKSLFDKCISSEIDYEIRAMDKPSDHCPVIAEFEI
jgi:exodeoxyribonuclease-3